MAGEPSRTADELATAIRSLVERALESQTRDQITSRGRELASAIAGTAGAAAGRASVMAGDAWRESAPQRKEAATSARKMSRQALKWGRATWKRQVGPTVRNAWDGRAAALAAAGIAVPTSKEIAKQAQKRLRLQRREERRWRTFFLGVIIGAIAGAVVALLTAPRPGREVRDELAQRAREAASNAGVWAPLFQRTESIDDLPERRNGALEPAATPVEGGTDKGNGAPRSSASPFPDEPGEPI
jgi:hypothetical protein